MRSPVIAFSIFAAATVSPTLVGAAPTRPSAVESLPIHAVSIPTIGGLPSNHIARRALNDGSDAAVPPTAKDVDAFVATDSDSHNKSKHRHDKRAYDANTAGGNAQTGGTSDSSGGTVVNEPEHDDDLTNTDANIAGDAGDSESGDAEGGRGRGRGPGGNASTGATGRASGGNIVNEGGVIDNTAGSNTGGDGAASDSGDASGGDAVKKRATDDRTAGGNAYTGSTGNTGSGNVVNVVDDDGTITNTGPGTNVVDASGDSTTGEAEGGNGDGKGPGGNAYSGFAGSTHGGNVVNEGGTIDNTGPTNTAGDGGDSLSGDSQGGDA